MIILDNETLEIYLNGKIDSGNVKETEESIQELLVENPHSKIQIDLSGLEEITDDGLKALKQLGEKSKNVELTNVTKDIYEVFEKQGITSIMPVYEMKIDVE